MKNDVYWIWLQLLLGCGSRKLLPVLEYFGSPKAVYDAGEPELRASRLLMPAEILRHRKLDKSAAADLSRVCLRRKIDVISMENPDYPKRLLRMMDPPAVLYVTGTLPVVDDEVCVAMVGTRRATPTGREAARRLACRLGKAGAVIVSGGAYGIDTACHKGGLSAGAKEICVMGCGVDVPCFEQNRGLRERIAETGAVISEFPPGYRASRFTFPMRNRIVSALSLCTVVIEAPARSGALITARTALEQGRDVFVIAGNPMAPEYAGSNRLLQDGARPVYTPMDILGEYAAQYPHRLDLRDAMIPLGEESKLIPGAEEPQFPSPAQKFSRPAPPKGISDGAKAIYNTIDARVISFDAMAARSGLSAPKAVQAVTELELMGILSALPGGKYEFACQNSPERKEE